ncbi:nuclear protein Qri2/Nse4 [Coccidioides immitis RS]|uniref:Non-structural maintenance of chromosomes element 4 n=3 Tax=Coccidioides immitis TaxID=5501 RepID=J3K8V7_COCIM|nr:nuclear protein Qri2/Nse4 [Coccidioides immitis RS]EAS31290.3 nuclear protein Qri2/Nse4 [Coccidioides immitis RS]KMP03919.1 hypothetical protein CIRG_03611 [Coccidioides immitis RMSCC 2394]KMU86078.1 hypothetical protein CIHG_03864 [Coccidioides immitis H538.4]TPX24116.1 nuclear protein [Coccidioides immitis]
MADTAADSGSDLSSTPPGSNAVSPSNSFSSDKENGASPGASRIEKRKQESWQAQSSNARSDMGDASNKRRRISGKDPGGDGHAAHRRALALVNDTNYYDPEQDPEERRAVRKGLRDLATKLNDSRSEFIQAGSNGIRETIIKANELFKQVKQTSDATIDSRLLVNAADLSYKRTAQAILGDSDSGIDVEEFVSKCISFMRAMPVGEGSPSQTLSSQRQPHDRNAEDSDDDDDALNWDVLGRQACFPHNKRPPLSGFLYGPLSVQKRVRQQTQRRARQERIDPSQAIRPQQLQAEDLGRQETANLTAICTEIRKILVSTQQRGEKLATDVLSNMREPSRDQILEVMYKYNISDDGGVPLFKFCINPRSFGQTVENLFYVSFLVRDGSVGVALDASDLPTLHPSTPALPSEAQRKGLQKHQAVFSLDFETWRNLIEVFDIKKPLIPHRNEDAESSQVNRDMLVGQHI